MAKQVSDPQELLSVQRAVAWLVQVGESLDQHDSLPAWTQGKHARGLSPAGNPHLYRLVAIVLLPGLLKDAQDTAMSLRMALRAVAPSSLASALEAGIDCMEFLPSHTTILRHRATLYWGFCLLRRELSASPRSRRPGILVHDR